MSATVSRPSRTCRPVPPAARAVSRPERARHQAEAPRPSSITRGQRKGRAFRRRPPALALCSACGSSPPNVAFRSRATMSTYCGSAAVRAHQRDFLIGHRASRATQTGCDDFHAITRGQPALFEARCERQHSSSPKALSNSASAPSVNTSLYARPSSIASISPRCLLAKILDPFVLRSGDSAYAEPAAEREISIYPVIPAKAGIQSTCHAFARAGRSERTASTVSSKLVVGAGLCRHDAGWVSADLSRCREGQHARAFKRYIERQFRIVAAAEFKRRDLERACDGAEVGHDHLPVPDRPVERVFPDRRIGRSVLENPRTRDARRLDARAGQELAPLARAFIVRYLYRLRADR